MQSFDIVASFFRLFSIAYTYIVAYWYIKYRRQAVIQVISISTLFPAANMIFSMKPPSDCCSHRDHVSLCFTPPTQVDHQQLPGQKYQHILDLLGMIWMMTRKGVVVEWDGNGQVTLVARQGMDRRDCQTRTANDVPNVPVNLALSSN